MESYLYVTMLQERFWILSVGCSGGPGDSHGFGMVELPQDFRKGEGESETVVLNAVADNEAS